MVLVGWLLMWTSATTSAIAWSMPESASSALLDQSATLTSGAPDGSAQLTSATVLPPRLPLRLFDAVGAQPLEDLSREAEAYAVTRPGTVGAAVIVPDRGVMYTFGGDEQFALDSVVKVAILAAELHRVQQEARPLTDREQYLLQIMITVSDNDAAMELWDDVGGGSALHAYLDSIGLPAIQPDPYGYWGDSQASAKDIALLMAKLAWGDILDPSRRELALRILGDVIPEQRWGATAGLPAELPPGTFVAVKNGWYPEDDGWSVNTAGLIVPGDDHPGYAIAVLTKEQPTYDTGMETTEGISARINTAMRFGKTT
jgi:beta-lactamase class A